MLKQRTVYFREEDLPLWENVQNKAQFLHDALTKGLTVVPPRNITPDTIIEPDIVEEYDYLDDLILDTAAGGVFDTTSGEKVAADPDMIRELKRRGQVR